MEKQGWKTLAIVLMVVLILLVSVWFIGYREIITENEKINTCYYDICSEYIDADYDADVCWCYEYGLLGEYVVAKTEYMN